MLTCLPAALAVDLNVDAGFYFKQSRGGTCTLASAAMMLRRRAYFDGLTDWSTVTENSVRSTAWSNGLSHSFTYKEMQVGYGTPVSYTHLDVYKRQVYSASEWLEEMNNMINMVIVILTGISAATAPIRYSRSGSVTVCPVL